LPSASGQRSIGDNTAAFTLAERLHADDAHANQNLPRLARLAEVWEKIVRAARDTETYNLERKPLVFSVFGWLADATR
jgi:DNA polymerase-3 subunit delta'